MIGNGRLSRDVFKWMIWGSCGLLLALAPRAADPPPAAPHVAVEKPQADKPAADHDPIADVFKLNFPQVVFRHVCRGAAWPWQEA